MSVLFKPDNASCYFNVLPDQRRRSSVARPAAMNFPAISTLPATTSGDYVVQAYMMRNAARRNEVCNYSLTGAQFNATGENPEPNEGKYHFRLCLKTL